MAVGFTHGAVTRGVYTPCLQDPELRCEALPALGSRCGPHTQPPNISLCLLQLSHKSVPSPAPYAAWCKVGGRGGQKACGPGATHTLWGFS